MCFPVVGCIPASSVEFAAAVGVLTRSICGSEEVEDDGIACPELVNRVEGIVQHCYPTVVPYFQDCLARGHKHFLWTGPDLQIIRRSEFSDSIMPLMTMGELLELPAHRIYQTPALTGPSDVSCPPPQNHYV